MERMAEIYTKTIRPELQAELASNIHAVARVQKVVVNVGLNQNRADGKKVASIEKTTAQITGQKPALRSARKAVSSFKIRQGEPVGLFLTLRGERMYDFLERLIRIALPRIRDFRGISRKNFDGRGNLSIGIREMSVFPEIRYEDMSVPHGMQITIVTSAKTDEAGEQLLSRLGIPFIKNG